MIDSFYWSHVSTSKLIKVVMRNLAILGHVPTLTAGMEQSQSLTTSQRRPGIAARGPQKSEKGKNLDQTENLASTQC